jgi:hypothetical protein
MNLRQCIRTDETFSSVGEAQCTGSYEITGEGGQLQTDLTTGPSEFMVGSYRALGPKGVTQWRQHTVPSGEMDGK